MHRIYQELLSGSNKFLMFILLCLITGALLFILNNFILTDDVYFSSLGEQLSYERVEQLLFISKKWTFVSYLVIPLLYLLKIFGVSICLMTGAVLFGYETSFKKVFHVALIGEYVLLIPTMIKVFWFLSVNSEYSLQDVQFFSPLSLLNLLDYNNLENWIIYPLQIVNVFEALYILLLSYGMTVTSTKPYRESIKLTFLSYGSGLFIWVVFITFLSTTLS